MDAGARDLADGVEAGHARCAVEVGDDTAAHVVRGGRDRDAVAAPGRCRRRRHAAVIDGNRVVEPLAHVRRVEVHVVVDAAGASAIRRLIADGDDVARREVFLRVHAGHHPLAGRVVQDRALAAHRLADRAPAGPVASGPRHSTVGMELHELDVARRQAGAQRERETVAGDRRRVRRATRTPARSRRWRARRRVR